MKRAHLQFALPAALLLALVSPPSAHPAAKGWLYWRGPNDNGTSSEKGLPEKLDAAQPLWTADLQGKSTPVIANGKLYILGHVGEGPDLQEVIACFDADTGRKLWQHGYNDFLSDIIYTRYSTSNPTVDPATGNVFMQGSQGLLMCFSPTGDLLWQHSMMESFGRMTFPNGRTSTPVVDGDLVMTHGITANWGADGPARDRFYAFDTKTGELVWYSTPGGQPKDSSYAPPTLAWWKGQRVFYCGTGDGSIVAVNALNGKPLWSVKISQGGVNTQVLMHKDKLIAIHGSENLDNSEIGRMIAVRVPTELPPLGTNTSVIFDMKKVEAWRNELSAFTSSPILVGDTIYEVSETGELCSIDAETGKIRWRLKIGIEQRNSSLIYADGKLYVPLLEDPQVKGKGAFFVVRPGEKTGELLSHIQLEGRCFGSPIVYNGKIYVQSSEKLYCFGDKNAKSSPPAETAAVKWPQPGPATELQIVPTEVLLNPGQTASFRVRKLDANGLVVEEVKDVTNVKWASYIPPTARVKARLDGKFDEQGRLVAAADAKPSAGAFEATLDGLKGYIRGRILSGLPIKEDFESFELNVPHTTESGVQFAYPPLPWIGARFKFEVREREGNKVFTKTIDNKLFQRASVFIGRPEMSNYTVEADVLSDGSRRKMSEVGLINQRYAIVLKGNSQQLEVNSNYERVRVAVPFSWSPNTWYHLKTRVDLAADGSGKVRAKAWKKGDAEPEAWSIDVPHLHAHTNGSPGLFGFSPQDMRVYIDNVLVTQNN